MEQITALCRMHKVRSLHAFGSVVKGGLKPESDIDLLLDLPLEDPEAFSEHYWALDQALSDLFRRPVDLISKRALRNRYFIQELDRTKIPLYEA
jgi:predicted nucleotidyltransferase